MANHIDVMKKHGERVPEPRTLETIKAEWDGWAEREREYAFLVGHIPALPPYGTQKILVSIDAGLVARIDRVSKNRSAFFASAAEYFLEEKPFRHSAL